jgi:hypothetical protein
MTNKKCSFLAQVALQIFIGAALIGCAPEKPAVVRHCPGKNSAEEALAALQSSATRLRPFVAYGSGKVSFYEKEKDKRHNEKIPTVKLWFEPPGNLRFWGDVAFNPRGLDVGSNEREFWFAGKPKEIGNVYIWGLWSQQTSAAGLLLSPKVLQQALGTIDSESGANWSLSGGRSGDVLTESDKEGRLVRRIHVENCDYRVASIEYFSDDGKLSATLRLHDYRDCDGMFVPEQIEIATPNEGGSEDTFEISLKSAKPADKIKAAVFERPTTKGFEEVYRMIRGRTVKQSEPKQEN